MFVSLNRYFVHPEGEFRNVNSSVTLSSLSNWLKNNDGLLYQDET